MGKVEPEHGLSCSKKMETKMNKVELKEKIMAGEDSYTQLKEKIVSAKNLAKEFVAFANARGGIIIFGVADDTTIIGLSLKELEEIGQLVGNVAQENCKPPIHPLTQNFIMDEKRLMVVAIESGASKPYKTSAGVFYTKSGADKKIMSDEELKQLFSEPKRLYADEEVLVKSDLTDLNSEQFMQFLRKDNEQIYSALKQQQLSFAQVLENRELQRDNHLTLAGNLIFGLEPQRFCPLFYIDCCYFDGNDIGVNQYISEKRLQGTFSYMLDGAINFLTSQLHNYQVEENFNSNSKAEIDERVLIELIVNALIHRDYYIQSSIKIFIFHDRVEIISPGKLTNSLTVEKIKSGLSIARNPILASICKTALPYTGYGSGIKRVIALNENVEFINDVDKEEFKCVIDRIL
jgi:predicted HTH transcriptional regulator